MGTSKPKKVAGHKRAKVLFGVTVVCECGKSFGPWYGKGARTQAHNEWRWHVDQHCEAFRTGLVQEMP